MSPRTWKDRIRDILNAISEIQAFTQGMDFEAFQSDEKTIRAVEMNLIIIGEAAGKYRMMFKKTIRSFPGL